MMIRCHNHEYFNQSNISRQMSAKTEELQLLMYFYMIIVMNILFVDNDIDSTNKLIKLNLQTQLANERKSI